MNFILHSGALTFGTYKGQGQLLVTETHLFALSQDPTAAMSLGMLGGLLGVLVGSLIDRLRKPAVLPDYLGDPDLAMLPLPVKNTLARTLLQAKIPNGKELVIRSTIAGFHFEAPGQALLAFRVGLINKGKLRKGLKQVGLLPQD